MAENSWRNRGGKVFEVFDLGVLYCETGEYEKALECYEGALDIRMMAARI
jgi:tetratricopeptide (TPR) repeat protein